MLWVPWTEISSPTFVISHARLSRSWCLAEDLVPRLLASPETSAEQVVESAIDALQPEEARLIQEASIEPTIQMFNDIYDVVLSDDPYQVPLNYGAWMPRAEGKIDCSSLP